MVGRGEPRSVWRRVQRHAETVWAFVASGATGGDRSGFAQVSPGEIAQRHAPPIRPERPERHGVVRWRCPTDAGDIAGCTGLDEGLALVDVVRCNDRERDARHHGQPPRAMTAGYVTSIVFERVGVTPTVGSATSLSCHAVCTEKGQAAVKSAWLRWG